MLLDVNIDQYRLQCEVTSLRDEPPDPEVTTSDWDSYGEHELEFRVVSGQVYDESGANSEVGSNACAELAETYAEFIEEDLWRQIAAARQDVA